MHGEMFDVLYNSLGLVLENLEGEPEIQTSENLVSKVKNARAFHKAMEAEHTDLQSNIRRLGQELEAMRPKTIDSEDIRYYIQKYRGFRKAGATPRVIYEIAKSDGAQDKGNYIIILANVFELPWQEVQTLIQEFEAK